MLTRKFVRATDVDRGFSGWRPMNQPTFDPGDGPLVAHDTLEHQKNDDGSIEAEWMAIGTAWWLRMETGYHHSKFPLTNRIEDVLSRDVMQTCFDIASRGDICDVVTRPFPTKQQRLDNDREATLEQMVALGLQSLANEWRYARVDSSEREAAIEWCCGSQAHQTIAAWIRAGYRQGRRRFPDPHETAHSVFDQIARQADKLGNEAVDGDQLLVSVNLREFHVSVKHLTPYGREYP